MAAIAHVGNSASGYSNSRTIPSFTPGANKLLILHVRNRTTRTVTAITGHGTWSLTPICTVDAAGNKFARYALVTSGSPSASTIVVTFSGANTCQTSCVEVTDADVSGGSAAAFVQNNCGAIYHGSGGPFTNTFPLSAFASATNLTLISGFLATAKEAGYTDLFTGGDFETYYLASEDTTPSYTSTNNFSQTIGLASEIKGAAGGPTISPNDLTSGTTISSPSLTQHNAMAVDSITIGTTVSSPSLTQHNAIPVDDMTTGTAVSEPSLTQHAVLSVDDLLTATTVSSPSLTQHNVLPVDDLSSSTTTSEPSLTQHNTLPVDDLSTATTVSNSALTIAGKLAVNSIAIATSIGEPDLVQHNLLVVNDLVVASLVSESSLAGSVALSVNDLVVGTSISQSTLDAVLSLLVDDMTVASVVSSPALTQHNVLVVDDLTTNTLISTVSFGGAIIRCLDGTVIIRPTLGGSISIAPTLGGSVKIH